jgi:hypothetical protein
MVIQENMPVSGIVMSWSETESIFKKYGISNTNKTLKELLSGEVLQNLLNDLNKAIGSSEMTCIQGG